MKTKIIRLRRFILITVKDIYTYLRVSITNLNGIYFSLEMQIIYLWWRMVKELPFGLLCVFLEIFVLEFKWWFVVRANEIKNSTIMRYRYLEIYLVFGAIYRCLCFVINWKQKSNDRCYCACKTKCFFLLSLTYFEWNINTSYNYMRRKRW